MKKRTINCSIPATLSFSKEEQNENERFTRGKLRVFYKGETPDHRLFNDTFSESIIKSLPYTPIVSYYDEKKDDFVGHATEQAIYGIVDPCGEVVFETRDDGNTWAVCDTVYYTKRPDKVGEIAKKIEGHSQSLELDPTTVKYVINYDERKHFKNIEFTAGHFVGVSVLGKDQKPAFTGSAFFTTDELLESLKLLHEYCDQNGHNQPGGNEMNLSEFIKLSWGETATKVGEAVDTEYGKEYFNFVVEMYEDRAICRFYSYLDGSSKLMRINYSISESGEVTLGEIHEVHVVYEDLPEPTTDGNANMTTETTTVTTEEPQGVTNPEQATEATVTAVQETETITEATSLDTATTDNTEDAVSKPENASMDNSAEKTPLSTEGNVDTSASDAATTPAANEEPATFAAQDVDANTQTTMEVGAVNEQNKEENSGSAPLTDSERAEFEALKRAQKEELLNSYKEYLSEDEYNGFFATIDSVSKNELETSLLKIYKDFQEREKAKPTTRVFSLSQLIGSNVKKNESKESELADYIGNVLGR